MMKANVKGKQVIKRRCVRSNTIGQKTLYKQKGVALIFALMIMAMLVGLAATMMERMTLQFHRSENLVSHQQAYWYSMGVEALAQAALEQTFEDTDDNVNLGQIWAIEDTQYPLDNGSALGTIRDMQACLNLNAFSSVSTSNTNERPYISNVLIAMLEEAGTDSYQAEVIADSLNEFVDEGSAPTSQAGVESDEYESSQPPYMAPNNFIADFSELRAVYQVSPQIMRVLRPVVCALPTNNLKVNVNTIRPGQELLLMGLFEPALSIDDAQSVIADRPEDGWKTVADFLAESNIKTISSTIKSAAKSYLTVDSNYFELDSTISVDSSRVRLRSLLYSPDKQTTTVIRRRFGGISERISNDTTEQ